MEIRELIAILMLIIAIGGVFTFTINSQFKGLQDTIHSFRTGLTDQINALRSNLEIIEKNLAVLEQRTDIDIKEVGDINQLLDNTIERLTDIELALNLSEPPIPPLSPQPVSLVISYPQNGDEIDWITSVAGKSTGIVTNKTLNLFLFVYPKESEGPYYVQNSPKVNPDGSWLGLVYFGRNPDIHPEDRGDHYLLYAIVTTANLQPGETFPELPESICQSSASNLARKD